MSIHIRNQETDRLIHQLAESLGVSPAEAVHHAVQQRLLESPSVPSVPHSNFAPQNSTVAAIDERRLQLARFDGMDSAIGDVREAIFVPAMLCLLMLLAAPLIGDKIAGIVLMITLASAGLLFSYSRSLVREKASRGIQRLTLARELRTLCASLPDDLRFLAWIPETRSSVSQPAASASPSAPHPNPGSIQ